MPETKWIVYACAATLCGVVAIASGSARKTFFIVMVLAIQANVTLMLAGATGTSYVGSSGPGALLIPLAVVVGVVLFGWHALTARLHGLSLDWTCGAVTIPGILVVLTISMTLFWSPEIRPVLYGLQDPLYGYVLCLATVNIVRSREDVSHVLTLLLVILGTQSMIYFVQNATGVEFTLTGDVLKGHSTDGLQRFGGTVSANPKGFAMFISVLTLIGLSAFISTRSRRLRRWSALLVPMGIAALVLSFTRAAWAGFLIGTVVITSVGLRRGRIKIGRLLLIVVVAVGPILALLPMVLVRLSSDHAAAYEERATLMRIAWRIIGDHPLGGVGTGAYGLIMRNYLAVGDLGTWLFIVHNAYLLRWAESGIFGLLAFLSVLFVGFRLAFRCTRSVDDATFILGLGCCAGFVHLCWEMWWDIQLGGTTPLLFWFLLGALQAAVAIEKRSQIVQPAVQRATPGRLRRAVA